MHGQGDLRTPGSWSRSRLGVPVSWVTEPGAVSGRDLAQSFPDGCDQRLLRTGRVRAEMALDFGPYQFDRFEVRRIGGKYQTSAPARPLIFSPFLRSTTTSKSAACSSDREAYSDARL